jgi:2-oxo-4-hydroxy-4-carboxy-5-ureidoimidazoline decarboxylase
MTEVLARWNTMASDVAVQSILPCCGSHAWAKGMTEGRPFPDTGALLVASRAIWDGLAAVDWLEAFNSHPRIGESRALASALPASQAWSAQEQRQVAEGEDAVKIALAEGNRQYEQRFGRIFIVCATGKAPREILQILQRRLQNEDAAEWREAAAEQQQITQLRLRKWLEA